MKSIVDSVTVKYPALDHLDHALEDLHHSFYYSFLAAQAKRDRTSILSTAENSQECSLRDLIDQEISADFEKRRLYRTLRIGGGVLSVVGVIIIWSAIMKIIGVVVFGIVVPLVVVSIVLVCFFINKDKLRQLWDAIKKSL